MANGILSQAGGMSPNPGGLTEMGAGDGTSVAGAPGGNPTTDEEQEAYTAAMEMAGELLYSNDKSSEGIMELIESQIDTRPAQAIADATSLIMSQIEEAFGGQYPEGSILETAEDISALVMEMVEAAGLKEFSEDDVVKAKIMTGKAMAEDYGVDEDDLQANMVGIAEQDLQDIGQLYEEI